MTPRTLKWRNMKWQSRVPFSHCASVCFSEMCLSHQSGSCFRWFPSWHVTQELWHKLPCCCCCCCWLVAHIKPVSQGIHPERVPEKGSLINTHKGGHTWDTSEAPYLPCLLQLRRPPLLQDGLHGADEFCSDVLENNCARQLLLALL